MSNWFSKAFTEVFYEVPNSCIQVSGHGSDRPIFRLSSDHFKAIGIISLSREENRAFEYLTETFLAAKLRVPLIYTANEVEGAYLVEYMGEKTLMETLLEDRAKGLTYPSPEVEALYRRAVEELPRFQIEGGSRIDYGRCYPKQAFDMESMLWDMNYYRREYLERLGIEFDSEKLQRDFQALGLFLLQAPAQYFMYRDFQSRNIMVDDQGVGFIDFQGGRRGPLQYDLVSLLYQSRAGLPQSFRDVLYSHYIGVLQRYQDLEVLSFHSYFEGFLLIRLLQVLGAYGNLGLGRGKSYFIESIPYALHNLEWLLQRQKIPVSFAELQKTFDLILTQEKKDRRIQSVIER
jgi:aminoglycoside/choline kinase family phosphotransferase